MCKPCWKRRVWPLFAILAFAAWAVPAPVVAKEAREEREGLVGEPARCFDSNPAKPNPTTGEGLCDPSSPFGQPSATSSIQPSGFQPPHNPFADLCSENADSSKGCWEPAFYPGGPQPAPWTENPLRSSWLDACLVKPNQSPGNPVPTAPDQHTKIACCNDKSCVKLGTAPFTTPGSSNPADCPASRPNAFACPFPAVSNILLPDEPKDGKEPRIRLLYWGGVDGVEDQPQSTGPGDAAFLAAANEIDSPWRVLDLTEGAPGIEALPRLQTPGGSIVADDTGGGGDRFCANQTILPSGTIMTAGGTRWGLTPGLELFGLDTTSVFDRNTNIARVAGPMHDGRWYMSMTPLPTGNVFGGAGIGTLSQPPTHKDTWEVFNRKTLTWTRIPGTDATTNPDNLLDSPRRLLPLFSRLILLPNGSVLYPEVGQLWGPFGRHPQGKTWAIAAHIEPEGPNPAWRAVLNTANVPDTTTARSGAQVLLMPLKPPYDKATVVSMSGIQDPDPSTPSPPMIPPVKSTEIMSFTFPGGVPRVTRTAGGNLNIARWFATGLLLADRSMVMIGGGTCDEVVVPGCERAIFTPERSKNPADPSEPWKRVANMQRPRTYHNTAGVLLPDGRVASAGHRPIPCNYADSPDAATGGPVGACDFVKGHDFDLFGSAQIGRDLMWEIYEPGYLFAKERPELKKPPKDKFTYGEEVCLNVERANEADAIEAQLMRPGAVTHVEQHEQRLVVLQTVGSCGKDKIKVRMPPNGKVAPPGFYLLSILEFGAGPNADWPDVPSEARFIQLCRKQKTEAETFGANCSGP